MEENTFRTLKRREFIKYSALGVASLPALGTLPFCGKKGGGKAKIAFVKTEDRKEGVHRVLEPLDFPSVKEKSVFIKPNFNTADPTPGSTHNDTLMQLIHELRQRDASDFTVGERSGPPPTNQVMEDKGIFQLSEDLDFKIINFEELPEEDWIHFNPEGCHWQDGFSLPRPAVEAEYLVSTYCLKTHQYGGVFTLSLKLAVGLTPKNLMRELHSSQDMRKMIAELNVCYEPQLLVLDGIEAFVDGGPMTGTKKRADVFLAGTDRVAMDAAAVAILKELGSNEAIMGRKIFDQEQIQRAVELGIGIDKPELVEFVTPDKASREYAEKIQSILMQG